MEVRYFEGEVDPAHDGLEYLSDHHPIFLRFGL
jgi:hypothetical protein